MPPFFILPPIVEQEMRQAQDSGTSPQPPRVHRVASVFREEFGLDEAEDLEGLRQAGLGPDGENAPNDGNVEETQPQQRPDGPPPTVLQRLADYFWGDILRHGAPEPAIAPAEERIGDGEEGQEAPFVPIQGGMPAIDAVPHNAADDEPQNDPEVVAAAQQAGLDAEAIEDAEDLEGIFELIGFQGPLIGLFQTSCFCTVLVTGTVAAAIGLPYVWGKLVLSLISAPFTLLIKLPLKLASSVADIVIDVALALGGWGLYFFARGNFILLAWIGKWIPKIGSYGVTRYLCQLGQTTADHAGKRLIDLFVVDGLQTEDFEQSWNAVFLSGSIHSHASLKTIKSLVHSVLNYTGHGITHVAEAISSGSVAGLWGGSVRAIGKIPGVPANFLAGVTALTQYVKVLGNYTEPFFAAMGSLKTGALTFQSATVDMDATLVYWSTTDRGLAVMTGYLSLAVIAAIYVALDTPITSSQSGQRAEKMIRDTLRQAGGVLKVILIISIEMLAFPLYCGLLLDFAFLPLFQNDSVATRWAFAARAPSTFCFIHWFVGTCYMFHFALFVGMCRKILRKGVLWFIRDPDDPTFHPVRDVLERNVTTQLRKIAFSALVYGALVILCLGGVIWSIGRVFKGIFPIQWISTEPVLEFPLDLLLYNFLTPLLFKLFKPSKAVNTMYAWWLRRCARVLRLSHFLFDDRRKDEEGRHVRKSWTSFILLKKANTSMSDGTVQADQLITQNGEQPEVYFKRDGKYVLTPCNDQYRPPKPGEAFLHADDNDVYIVDKEGKKNEHFAKIYVPPFFRLRVTLFMVCLWLFSAFTGLCVTLVPLVFGRQIFASMLPAEVHVNDIYAYTLGAYILVAGIFFVFKGTTGARYLREKAQTVDIKAWAGTSTRYSIQALKCVYVYGFLGVVVPLLFAMFLQFYLILPLHTYLVSSFGPLGTNVTTNATAPGNITVGFANLSGHIDPSYGASLAQSFADYAANLTSTSNSTSNMTQPDKFPSLADHSIHILADYALGLLYVRIAVRLILTTPNSRASQAFHLITANGYLNPNVRLATRYFVLPTTLLAMVVLLTPLWLAKMAMTAVSVFNSHFQTSAFVWQLDEAARTLLYRYSYPAAAACAVLLTAFTETGRVLGKWRASVRDEVYLVGERLHNFGEGKPPVGSRSVVRKDR
jgi:E3 ubiquitin-protein ligase MARCH6